MPSFYYLTKPRRLALERLDEAGRPVTTHEIGALLRRRLPASARGDFGRANYTLRKLAEHGLVERHKQPGSVATWTITEIGKGALDT